MTKPPLHLAIYSAVLFAAMVGSRACAQTSSLYQRDLPVANPQSVPTLEDSSWTYRQLPSPREIKVNDLLTIRVDERSQTVAEGEVQRRKNELYNAVLRDWIILDGLKSVYPDPQSRGDPRITGNADQIFRATSELETLESVTFNITATIVDIRPNGTLVLEAHKQVQNNDEVWDLSLSGICRKEDIQEGNMVLSQNIAELRVHKRERGLVRDGYRRGWFFRWFDTFNPF